MRRGYGLVAILSLALTSCSESTPTPKVAEQAADGPVTASIETDFPQLRPGGRFDVKLQLRIAPGWHIYAVDLPAGTASPTSLEIEVPAGIERAGEWILPQASPDAALSGGVSFIYDGLVTFQCPLRVAGDAAPGEKTIGCLLRYQACDRFSCRPPAETTLVTTVRIVP